MAKVSRPLFLQLLELLHRKKKKKKLRKKKLRKKKIIAFDAPVHATYSGNSCCHQYKLQQQISTSNTLQYSLTHSRCEKGDDPLPYIGAPSRAPTAYGHPQVHAHSPDKSGQHYWLPVLSPTESINHTHIINISWQTHDDTYTH